MYTFYEVLGVNIDCNTDDIRRAYKRLAKIFHPDKNTNPKAHVMMSILNEAKATLIDSKRRDAYNCSIAKTTDKQFYQVDITVDQVYNGDVVNYHGSDLVIPAGIRDKTYISHKDSVYKINVRPHPIFKISGDDIKIDLPVNALDVIVGSTIEIPLPDRTKTSVKLNDALQHNDIITLEHYGMCNPISGKRGKLLITVNIVIPRLTSDEKRNIMHILNKKM